MADRLGVDPETVGRWIRAKELGAIRLRRGGKLWIAPVDLTAFLKKGRTA